MCQKTWRRDPSDKAQKKPNPSLSAPTLILTDLNPYGGIAANCWLVELGPFRLVVDCGISPKHEGYESVPKLAPTRHAPLDLVLLTHCHLDHIGALPLLMREHPETWVAMSAASKLLARRMLHNSCNVMIKQREETGNTDLPLYRHREIERLGERVFPMPCDHPRFFNSARGESLAVTFHRAGHVPGAVGITLEHHHRRILFTGDVLFQAQRILQPARFPKDRVDTLIMETTRGASPRDPETTRDSEIERLLHTLRAVASAGGDVLIPVFALGRMQEMIAVLHEAKVKRTLPDFEILASGLGIDLVDHFDEIARKTGAVRFSRHLYRDLGIRRMEDRDLPARRQRGRKPALYLVSSGMMIEHTPSYTVASQLVGNPHNAVCFVGYSDPDTPGGKLLAARHGDDFLFEAAERMERIEARIEKFDLSSHADRDELLQFALERDPRAVVLAHGDAAARAWFREQFAEIAPHIAVHDPVPLVPTRV